MEPICQLTPLSDHWLPFALGRWGVSCDQVGFPEYATEDCDVIEFIDATSGRVNAFEGGGASSPEGEVHEMNSHWIDFTFALRNITTGEDGNYELDVVMFGDFAEGEGVPARLVLSDDGMALLFEEGSGIATPLQLSLME